MENVFIRINKLDEFNPRTDTKKHYWARLDLDIHCSRSLVGLDCEQRWFFICLISQAVKYRNSNELVPFDVPWLSEISKVSLDKIASCLEHLRQNKTISFIHENGEEIDSVPKNFQKCADSPKNGAYNTDGRTDNTDNTDGRTKTCSELSASPPPPKKTKPKIESNPINALTWDAYKAAYLKRYKIEPKRNVKLNSLIKQFVERLGEDAPHVASFYVHHNDSFYMKKTHQFNLALSDAETLHTQWSKGRAITQNDIKKFEKSQEQNELIAAIERGEV